MQQPRTDEEFRRYFHLRWKLLRAPWEQAEGSEIDALEDQCFHIMATQDDEVIAVARLQKNTPQQGQIRYMAVANAFRRKGIGRALITALEQQARNEAITSIVLDAREPALDFYRSLGYSIEQKSYVLFDEIQHYRMVKQL